MILPCVSLFWISLLEEFSKLMGIDMVTLIFFILLWFVCIATIWVECSLLGLVLVHYAAFLGTNDATTQWGETRNISASSCACRRDTAQSDSLRLQRQHADGVADATSCCKLALLWSAAPPHLLQGWWAYQCSAANHNLIVVLKWSYLV